MASHTTNPDVVLIGSGVMSANPGLRFRNLENCPSVIEKLKIS